MIDPFLHGSLAPTDPSAVTVFHRLLFMWEIRVARKVFSLNSIASSGSHLTLKRRAIRPGETSRNILPATLKTSVSLSNGKPSVTSGFEYGSV